MNTNYPTLADMGIVNPEQIHRYSLQTSKGHDLLRIVYRREKGSLLPSSKKFKFPRATIAVEQDPGSNQTQTITEISPALSKAITELHKIVNHKHSREEQKEIIREEIHQLEEEIHTRVKYLKTLVKKLDE